MFHVKRLLSWLRHNTQPTVRTTASVTKGKPRILGHVRPYYSRACSDFFARVGGAAKTAAWIGDTDKGWQKAVDELDLLADLAKLYANDHLLEITHRLIRTAKERGRADVDLQVFKAVEDEYYTACREALGIEG